MPNHATERWIPTAHGEWQRGFEKPTILQEEEIKFKYSLTNKH